GQIHHQKKQLEMEKMNLQQEKEKLRSQQMGSMSGTNDFSLLGGHDRYATNEDWGILTTVSRFMGKLFR
ncbi:MAG: hypothetical protein JSV88_24685, partial [Candidatus Aminicenantes bacterium]